MDPFVSEIRIFCGDFAPFGWAFCNGQLLPISQNTALFSLLGTTYGGNGATNFALPNLQGCFPMHPGNGPGLTSRSLGETGGVEAVTLLSTEMPAHIHAGVQASSAGNSASATGNVWAAASNRTKRFSPSGAANVTMAATALGVSGGGLPHNNLPPYLAMNFIIALQGIYPARN